MATREENRGMVIVGGRKRGTAIPLERAEDLRRYLFILEEQAVLKAEKPFAAWWVRHRLCPWNNTQVEATLVWAPAGIRPRCPEGWTRTEFAYEAQARAYLFLLPLECGAKLLPDSVRVADYRQDAREGGSYYSFSF